MFNALKWGEIFCFTFLLSASAIGEDCFNDALAYESKARGYIKEPSKYYEKALSSYLCAAKSGNSEAAYKAALLGQSGQTGAIQNAEVERLLIASANGGYVDARIALANLYCGEHANRCLEPLKAEHQLLQAAKLGSGDGANMLGNIYEKGWLGTVDLPRATACYKKASEFGSTYATENLKRISKSNYLESTEENNTCF